jgi:DNA-binding LytR/AlgR family response regulator
MQVLIVDDEPLAQDILETYISKTPGLSLAGKCSNALEAFALLSRQPVDLMLLDINMPEISGIDFLRTLKHVPLTVFTTAYSEFAIAGYDLDVVDYLLKPIPFERFLKAVQKARGLHGAASTPVTSSSPQQPDILFVRADGRLIRIALKDLAIVEGLKDYVRLWVDNTKLVIHTTMKSIEESLSTNPAFLRISKSYIVNLSQVTEIDGNCVVVKDQRLTIGATYKEAVMEVINRFKLL